MANTFRIKRRVTGVAGAPATLKSAVRARRPVVARADIAESSAPPLIEMIEVALFEPSLAAVQAHLQRSALANPWFVA